MNLSILSLILFIILTLAYSILKYFIDSKAVTIIYFALIFISQFLINIALTNQICGFKQPALAFTTTLFPWTIIFGSLNVLFMMFPGWKAPFSNTFGYLAARVGGIKTAFNAILPSKISNKALQAIYEDNSLMINEITPANFEDFWSKMQSSDMLSKSVTPEAKASLYKLVRMKDIVAEFVWYLLAGVLISSITFSYISNSKCKRSAEYMKQQHEEWKKNADKLEKKKKEKVYYVRD
jgi:hypothetical protein